MVKFMRVPSSGIAGVVAGCLAIATGCSSSSPAAGGGGGAGANGGASSSGSTGGSAGGARQTGGSSGTTSSAFATTVGGSQTLDVIPTALAQQLCKDAYAYIRSQITLQQSMAVACSLQAIVTAFGEAQACHAAYTACIGSDAGTSSSNECNTEPEPTGCEATVSQYVTCLQDQIALTKPTLSQFGPEVCDQLDAGLPSTPKPASCQAIAYYCADPLYPGL